MTKNCIQCKREFSAPVSSFWGLRNTARFCNEGCKREYYRLKSAENRAKAKRRAA